MKWITSTAIFVALCTFPAVAQPLSSEQKPDLKEALEAVRKIVEDPDGFYRKLLPSAESGNVRAQFIVGQLLTAGGVSVVPPDRQKSLGLWWIRKSASAGHFPAMSHLSDGYRRGRGGLPQDADLADCYQRAALRLVASEKCSELERAKGYTDQR